jgi:hypothetical protein
MPSSELCLPEKEGLKNPYYPEMAIIAIDFKVKATHFAWLKMLLLRDIPFVSPEA